MLSKLLTLLFPPDEKEQLVIQTDALPSTPTHTTLPNGKQVLTCAPYDEPAVRASLSLLKTRGNARATQLLATLLSDVLLEEYADATIWNTTQTYIVPMPISKRRRRERGFNQMEQVCALLPDELRALVRTDVLVQTKHIPMQKTLSRSERLTNVVGIFEVIDPAAVSSARIILIDDVTTTGATLAEAIRVLRNSGASVTAVALAHA